MQAWVSCSGVRTTACDPHALGGDQCGEQRGPELKYSTTTVTHGAPYQFSAASTTGSRHHPSSKPVIKYVAPSPVTESITPAGSSRNVPKEEVVGLAVSAASVQFSAVSGVAGSACTVVRDSPKRCKMQPCLPMFQKSSRHNGSIVRGEGGCVVGVGVLRFGFGSVYRVSCREWRVVRAKLCS